MDVRVDVVADMQQIVGGVLPTLRAQTSMMEVVGFVDVWPVGDLAESLGTLEDFTTDLRGDAFRFHAAPLMDFAT